MMESETVNNTANQSLSESKKKRTTRCLNDAENTIQPASPQKKRRVSSQKKLHRNTSPETDVDFGCLGVLKKISCTLQCAGKTCSIKETSPPSLSSSVESVSSESETPTINQPQQQLKTASKKRAASNSNNTGKDSRVDLGSQQPSNSQASSNAKKARRSSPKKGVPAAPREFELTSQ